MTPSHSDSISTRSSGLRAPTGDEQRTFLAGERTLLAWVRTSLALMGFGFLVAKFGLFLREVVELRAAQTTQSAIQSLNTSWSLWIGVALVALGVLVNLFAVREHLRFIKQFAGTELAARRRFVPLVWMLLMLATVGIVLAAYLVLVGR